MSNASSKNFRAGMGLGAAFVIGIVTFFATFQVINHFHVPEDERLDPPEKRTAAGPVVYPVLNAEGTGVSAEAWSLKAQKGKVVVINFFATWCGPCMQEIPNLSAISTEYASRGVVFAAISVDHDNETKEGVSRLQALREFTQTHHLPFPILVPDADSTVMKMSFPIPQTVVYDREGRRARLMVGAINKASLERSVEELLKEK